MPATIVEETTGFFRAVYTPAGYGVRRMLIDSNWTKLNLGVRLIQFRIDNAATSLTGHRFYLGLCFGTTNPVGAAVPAHFIGVRSGRNTWYEHSNGTWVVGYEIVSFQNGTLTIHGGNTTTTTDGALKKSIISANQWSAWYLQFEKVSGTQIKVTLFIPTRDSDGVSESQFVAQMARTTFSTQEAGHSLYTSIAPLTFNFDEGTYGVLNAVNFMGTPPDAATGVGGMRWASVKAVKLT